MTDAEFAAIWNVSSSVADAASRCRQDKGSVKSRAYKCRKSGHSVKKFPTGSSPNPSNHTMRRCLECRRDFRTYPSEVRTGRKYCSVLCARSRPGPIKHGLSKTRLHNIWCNMKSRCRAKNGARRQYYSSRGIKVCSTWRRDFMAFRDWAMRNGYENNLELDRKRNSGNYSPSNCRWANRTQQMQNTRKRQNAKTSRYKGVSRHSQNGTWVAQIHSNRRTTNLGSFGTQREAARAYDKAARKRFGKFSNVNFKEE